MTNVTRPDFKTTKAHYDKVLPVVKEKWPNLFDNFKRKPLARRIAVVLIKETGLSAEEIHSFLAIWCSDYHYQRALLYSLYRFNLENKAVSVISWEERAQACERYHNYLMKRQNGSEGLVEPCPVFTKETLAREMYNHYCAHIVGCEATGVTPETAEHFFSVDEINFLVAQYKGDRNETEFKTITTAYLKINEGGETIKRPSYETKS